MKHFIKKLLREAMHPSMSGDTWSTFTGKKSYQQKRDDLINSVQSFNDITEDMIPEIINQFGSEGFNSPEDAIEDLSGKIATYQKFPNPVKLYRIVAVKNKKLIRTKKLGEHFTPYKWAIDDDMLRSIGYENWESDWIPYVMEVSAPLSQIHIWQTIVQNLNFPHEHEINLKNNGKGAKFIKAVKYK